MKTRYKISDNSVFDLCEGTITRNDGQVIELTAYQERFLKYLVMNPNKPCVSGKIRSYVYRGETTPKEHIDFHQQLIQKCPALRERIRIEKIELMDIGYRYNLPKASVFANLWPNLSAEELQEEPAFDFKQLAKDLKEIPKKLTPVQKTVLRILILHHDQSLTYPKIVQLSHTTLGAGEQPLNNSYDIIKACNELQETIPLISEVLKPVYLNTIAYIYEPFAGDVEFETKTSEPEQTADPIDTTPENTPIPYPSVENLDNTYYHIVDRTYISAVHRVAITYQTHNTVTCVKLPRKVAEFLNVLIQNSPCCVSKRTICRNIYDDYYETDSSSEDRRLYDLNRRLKKLVPEIEGCLKTHTGTGYSILFSHYK